MKRSPLGMLFRAARTPTTTIARFALPTVDAHPDGSRGDLEAFVVPAAKSAHQILALPALATPAVRHGVKLSTLTRATHAHAFDPTV